MKSSILALCFLFFSAPVFAQENVDLNAEISTEISESSVTFDDHPMGGGLQASQASVSGESSMVSRNMPVHEIIIIIMVVLMIFGFIVVLICFPVFLIAQKTGTPNPYFAFIPILNYYLLCKISGRPVWWVVLYLVPFVNLIIDVLVWMDLARVRNKPSWIGILVILPLVNLGVMWYLALSDA